MPKIWMIISSFFPAVGGAEIQVHRLSRTLREKGLLINILTRRHMPDFQDLQPHQIIDFIPVTRLYSFGKGRIGLLLFLLNGLRYLIKHSRGDIFHAHGEGTPAWLAVLAARLCAGKSLIKLRTGVFLYQTKYFKGLAGFQFRLLLRLTDQIIVVNKEVRNWLINTLMISNKKIALIPNSVDLEEFFPVSSKEKKIQRKQLDLPLDKKIFLYVGRLNYLKGVDILINAWSEIQNELRKEMFLLLLGDGPERPMLEQLATELEISDSIRMLGMRENVRGYHWASDIFVLPSRTEGLSNALVEAMACGLPSIVSAVGGSPDLVIENQNGMLFESGNSKQLAKQLTKMVATQNCWQNLGTQARLTAQKKVNMETISNRLHEIYHSMA